MFTQTPAGRIQKINTHHTDNKKEWLYVNLVRLYSLQFIFLTEEPDHTTVEYPSLTAPLVFQRQDVYRAIHREH